MNYVETIRNLFAILADCNTADCDEQRQSWQVAGDSSQRHGAYGHVRAAIVALAGESIVAHWADSGEIDITLADRLAALTDRLADSAKACVQTARLHTDRAKRLNQNHYAKAETPEELDRWHKEIMQALGEAAMWSQRAQDCRDRLAGLSPGRRA